MDELIEFIFLFVIIPGIIANALFRFVKGIVKEIELEKEFPK